MTRTIRNVLIAVTLAGTTGLVSHPFEATAAACPSCKNANETDSLRPRAYMYSILFMLAMPATVFTCFGIAFYRMSKNQVVSEQLSDLLDEV